MKAAGTLLLVTAIIEGILGIPLLGGTLVMLSGYTLLFATLILHIVTLVLCSQHNKPVVGSILGIITSVLAWIPILGMIMHLTTALFLFIGVSKNNQQNYPTRPPAPGSF
ncbi:hypothetical protein BK120_33325 [Paenibacillus sp. FSL A5-0031]|uniref:hypothetical protein n=1 Tax=unclassified Paenibacillus TaxID=185978 RepID=UPI00096E961D|nr:hypothetical protein [Paenibacillus sp. FSL A5-0031]OME71552.1 hypothetical protein BK120_33325 [Paenibacillus sp. FSL A5-0031]